MTTTMTANSIITRENLKAVGRTKPPQTSEDYNYYINQLVEAGRISAHTAAALYKR